MIRYYKNNQVVARPKSLIHNGRTYLNPTDEVLIDADYEETDISKPVLELPEEIKELIKED